MGRLDKSSRKFIPNLIGAYEATFIVCHSFRSLSKPFERPLKRHVDAFRSPLEGFSTAFQRPPSRPYKALKGLIRPLEALQGLMRPLKALKGLIRPVRAL